MLRLAVVMIVTLAGAAHADPPESYVEPGVGVLALTYEVTGAYVEGSYAERLRDSTWVHVEVAGAPLVPRAEGILEARAGLELRPRVLASGTYLGADLAFIRGAGSDSPDTQDLTGGFAIPRAGIELGGRWVRFRLGLELPVGLARVHDVMVVDPFDASMNVDRRHVGVVVGFGLAVGLAVQL